MTTIHRLVQLFSEWNRYRHILNNTHRSKPGKSHGLSKKIIVSLTTLPQNISSLTKTLHSLLDQTILPDQIEVNIPTMCRRSHIPYDLSQYVTFSPTLSFHRVPTDLGPITKLIPTLDRYNAYPNTLIICVDDDNCYPNTLIEEFLNAHQRYPNAALTRTGAPVPASLKDSDRIKLKVKGHKITQITATEIIHGYTGFCVQPRFFDEDFSNPNTFQPETYYCDDIWISGHLARKNISRYVIPTLSAKRQFPFTEASASNRLSESVNKGGSNSEKLMRHFSKEWTYL